MAEASDTTAFNTAAFDTSVWRAKGAPLIPATGTGPLSGESVAVKDLFTVAGEPLGAGNPSWLAQAQLEETTAPAVVALLNAGAEVTGIAQTDEFALSLAGTNGHYGTPPNPAAPGRIPGGSSSGSATAVSLGEASIGLGTDTGGSVRVPAAYQGLWGIRTTHGLVSCEGLLPLAQSFDCVGWMARTPQLLAAAAEALVPKPQVKAPSAPSAMGGMGSTSSIPVVPKGPVGWNADRPLGELRFAYSFFALADEEVAEAGDHLLHRFERINGKSALEIPGAGRETLQTWLDEAFQPVQIFEAWQNHGDWISRHWESMTVDVGQRYRKASQITAEQAEAGMQLKSAVRQQVRSWVADGVLAVPSTASVAPTVEEAEAGGEGAAEVRRRNLQLLCIAGLAGLPVVNVPMITAEGLPAGLSLIGPAGSDKALIRYAARIAEDADK